MLMNLSIVSRFRGALLGAVLGECLGIHCQSRPKSEQSWQTIELWAFQAPTISSAPGRSIPSLIERLTQLERQHQAFQNSELLNPQHFAEHIIELLPVLLLGFDHPAPTRMSDYPWAELPEFAPHTLQVDGLILHHVLSLVMRSCPPRQLIPRVIDRLNHPEVPNLEQITSQLWHIQTLVESGCVLASARQSFDDLNATHSHSDSSRLLMPIPLYGFLSTPDDPRLVLVRTAQLGHAPMLSCALAGAIAGAHAGVQAFPLAWRQQLSPTHRPSPLNALWNIASEAALFDLADQLAATWAGVYNPSTRSQISSSPLLASLTPSSKIGI